MNANWIYTPARALNAATILLAHMPVFALLVVVLVTP